MCGLLDNLYIFPQGKQCELAIFCIAGQASSAEGSYDVLLVPNISRYDQYEVIVSNTSDSLPHYLKFNRDNSIKI